MKVTIEFEYLPEWHPLSYWAIGGKMKACGESYADAEARLKEKLQRAETQIEPPEPKEIEI